MAEPTEDVVNDPPSTRASGRAESPSFAVTGSSGTPSVSAASWVVRVGPRTDVSGGARDLDAAISGQHGASARQQLRRFPSPADEFASGVSPPRPGLQWW